MEKKERKISPLFEEYERQKLRRRDEDRRSIQMAVLAAIILHIGLLYMIFPEFGTKLFEKAPRKMIKIRQYRPPPPKEKIPPPPPKKQLDKKKRKIKPIPDPTPDEPEVEPEPELEPEPIYDEIPSDVDVIFGDPEPPPFDGPIVVTGDIVPPRPVKSTMVKPKYPEAAKMLRIQGDVIIKFVVSKQGLPQDFMIMKGLGKNSGCDEAAVEALSQWIFKPALQNGKPVAVYWQETITFTLTAPRK